jgi:hypothetical protein
MYHLETIHEYINSVQMFHMWLYREKKENRLEESLYTKIQKFALGHVQPINNNWATHCRHGRITLSTNTSLSEAMHSALKTGYMCTNPQMNMGQSARQQIAKSNKQLSDRTSMIAQSMDKTALWHAGLERSMLTAYAANLNGSMMDRREEYGVVQGT